VKITATVPLAYKRWSGGHSDSDVSHLYGNLEMLYQGTQHREGKEKVSEREFRILTNFLPAYPSPFLCSLQNNPLPHFFSDRLPRVPSFNSMFGFAGIA